MDNSSVTDEPTRQQINEVTRWVQCQGAANIRDLGGYPTSDGRIVRWGELFRGDSPHRLDPDDLGNFDRLGVRTRVDLRREEEIATFGSGEIGQMIGVTLSTPLLSSLDSDTVGTVDLSDLYHRFALEHCYQLASAIRFLSVSAHRPAFFHCYAGKDRTGVLAALLLGTLGVPEDLVIADYALTSLASKKFLALAGAELAQHLPPGVPLDDNSPALLSQPETMARFLTLIKSSFGSVTGYVEWAGVSREDIDLLRRELLVTPPHPLDRGDPTTLHHEIDEERRSRR